MELPNGRGYVATPPTWWPFMTWSPTLKRFGPPDSRGSVAYPPTCGPLLTLSSALQYGRPARWQVFVFNPPTCGPMLTTAPALKHWGPPRRHGLCSQYTLSRATSDFLPRSEAFAKPQTAGFMSPIRPLLGQFRPFHPLQSIVDPPNGRVYATSPPSYGLAASMPFRAREKINIGPQMGAMAT